MADDARHPAADLTAPAAAGADFFALLAGLESADQRFGRSGGPDREPARLGQNARLAFSVRDIARVEPAASGRPARVEAEVIGLLGPEGPLPLHLTRWVMARLSERWFRGDDDAAADTTFLDFCNLLQHRMIALYWRAWADARPDVQVRHGGGRLDAMLGALSGTGLPGTSGRNDGRDADFDRLKRAQATSLAAAAHGPERLAGFVGAAIAAPVRLEEFVGHFIAIPAHLQTRLGQAHAALGRGAVAGARSFQRQGRIGLGVGPLSLARYRDFLPGSAGLSRLAEAVLFAAGHEVEADVTLILAAAEVPPARLGSAALGRTGWLAPRPGHDASDMRIRSATRRAMPERRAA
jgi:type VI secretion system protein ImpH